MIPKIKITYSDIYDIALSGLRKIKYNPKRRIKGEQFAKKLQKIWDKHSKEILSYMSKLTGLKWPRNYIECTVSYNAPYSFSHPLTLFAYKSIEYNIVTLVHELVHILLWENKKKVRFPKSNTGIYRKYHNENYNTLLHLPVHAIVILTIKKIFGEKAKKYLYWERWWDIWKNNPRGKNYKRSWEIVEKEGRKNVIKNIIK